MSKRDQEINDILSAIDSRAEDGSAENTLPEDGLLGSLPISGNRSNPPAAPVKEEAAQIIEEEEDEEEGETEDEESRKKRRTWHKVGRGLLRLYYMFESLILIGASLAICAYLSWFLLTGATDFLGINQEDQQYEIVLKEETTVKEASELLKEKNVISSPMIFRLYAKLKEVEVFPAGTYLVNSNMSFDSVVRRMRISPTERPSEVEVVFREGLTVNEIAALLEENDVCEADKFIDTLESTDFMFDFEQQILPEEHRFYKLEGYLFPDTYNFYVGENPKSVANRFLTRFNELIFTDKMTARMKEMGMSLDETIILASMIQAEAGGGGYKEMCYVSSVFHNRLDHPEVITGMLQSDVTVFYVNDNIKPYLNYTDQDMYDAYNTYKCIGLPVGAICNPGLDAIQAALNPEETDYYYFLTDDSGKFYYARNQAEHEYNDAAAAQVNAQLKKEAEQAAS